MVIRIGIREIAGKFSLIIAILFCFIPTFVQNVKFSKKAILLTNVENNTVLHDSLVFATASLIPLLITTLIDFVSEKNKIHFSVWISNNTYMLILVNLKFILLMISSSAGSSSVTLILCVIFSRQIFLIAFVINAFNNPGFLKCKNIISFEFLLSLSLLISAAIIVHLNLLGEEYFIFDILSVLLLVLALFLSCYPLFIIIHRILSNQNESSFKTISTVEICFGAYYLMILVIVLISFFLLISPSTTEHQFSVIPLTVSVYIQSLLTLLLNIIPQRIEKYKNIRTERALVTRKSFIRYICHELRTCLTTVDLGLNQIEFELHCHQQGSHSPNNTHNINNSLRHNHSCPDEIDDITTTHDVNNSPEIIIQTLKDMSAANEIALNILNDALSYDKLEEGVLQLEKRTIDPIEFITNIIRPFSAQARQSNITVTFESLSTSTFAHDEQPTQHGNIFADKYKLGQVYRNILSNAVKFTPPGGKIDIRTSFVQINSEQCMVNSKPDHGHKANRIGYNATIPYFRVDVIDNGPGITKENQCKLFKEIIQFSPGELQKGGGSGLGLWISRGIVELHGGSISVSSEGLGEGTTFSVLIPLATSADMGHTANLSNGRHPLSGFTMNQIASPLRWSKANSRISLRLSSSFHYDTENQIGNISQSRSGKKRELSFLDSPVSEVEDYTIGLPISQSTNSLSRVESSAIMAPPRSPSYTNLYRRNSRARSMSDGGTNKVVPVAATLENQSIQEALLDSLWENGQDRHSSLPVFHPSAGNGSPPQTVHNSYRKIWNDNSRQQFFANAEKLGLAQNKSCEFKSKDNSYRQFNDLRILVVDDSLPNVKLLCRLLQRDLNSDCVVAVNGQIAVELVTKTLLAKQYFDVILMDFEMPVMNGPTATKKLRDLGYKGIIIGVTGNMMPTDVTAFLTSGANSVMPKPFRIEMFKSQLKSLVHLMLNVTDLNELTL